MILLESVLDMANGFMIMALTRELFNYSTILKQNLTYVLFEIQNM